ncbi:C3a anaphylatoxin chemotactic receptor-like [Notothenia coriiceps]|uniref:C3a anaphylatoxin chemotactic receptor-like n=1 Tax=Notothenia coriiceps TaxID=8208 RepID=A0A6I9PB44_9TELE|nr:PREDICTED: C3a anaphylatoxin chemotactic receptor-like [Notothenia coriiceps]
METDDTNSSLNDTYSTVDEQEDYNRVGRALQTTSLVIYCLIFAFGTIGNSLVIYVTGCRMKRTVNSVWFLNLALADFLFSTFLIFTIISTSQGNHWMFGRVLCKLKTFVIVVNMFASIFLLTAISVDRCLSIWFVVWAQNKRTVGKAQIICAVIWITAGVCSAPFAHVREVWPHGEKIMCNPKPNTGKQTRILDIFRFFMGFLIPFLVICVSYVAIVVRAGHLKKPRKQRCRRVIFSVVLAFFICWLPLHVFIFVNSLNPNLGNIIVQIVGPLVLSLCFMNSCLNPILYVFMCHEFQQKLKRSVCFALESALAEDHLSFTSSRSLTSYLSRISRKSDSTAPVEMKGPATFSTTEPVFVHCTEGETLGTDED